MLRLLPHPLKTLRVSLSVALSKLWRKYEGLDIHVFDSKLHFYICQFVDILLLCSEGMFPQVVWCVKRHAVGQDQLSLNMRNSKT